MVTSVQPTTLAPVTLSPANLRLPQTGNDNSASGDAVSVSSASDISAAQTGLSTALGAADLALSAGRAGASLLSQIRDIARQSVNADDPARAALDRQFQSLLQQYGETIDSAVKGGAGLLAGGSVTATLDPNAGPVTIQGYDLTLKQAPGPEDAVRLSSSSALSDPTSSANAARDADASLARVDAALGRLSAATQKLSAHGQFLSTLDANVTKQVSEPSDADGARLMALQVQQGLAGVNAAIANSAPQVLGLFK